MTPDEHLPKLTQQQLRDLAENRVRSFPADVSGMSFEEVKRLVSELQIHQEELDIQNEELRRAHFDLVTSHGRYADLYDFAPVGYLTLDAAGDIVEANLTVANLLGIDRSKLIGRRLAIYCDDHSKLDLIAHLEQVLSSEAHHSCQLLFQTRCSKELFGRLDSNSVTDSSGMAQIRIALTDITEQYQLGLALCRSEEKFRLLTEKSSAIVLIVRSEHIVYCNPTLATLTGYTNDELLKMYFLELVHPDYRDLVSKLQQKRVDEEDLRRCEVKFATKNGAEPWFDLSSQITEFEGSPAEFLTCFEITNRKLAEKRIDEMELQLNHVSRLSTMGELVAGIAHEINQPLYAIANYSKACANVVQSTDYQYDAPIDTWLREINQQAVRCGDIVHSLRRFVTKGDGDRRLCDLNCVVRDSITLIENNKEYKAVTFHCHLPSPGPQIHANEVQLQQVLVNLLANACEATNENPTPEIDIHLELTNSGIRLAVEDNGRGVETSQQEQLFNAFYTTKPDGMGMGLAISRSIIEAHEGTLSFDAETSSRAKFLIKLPVVAGASGMQKRVQ